MIDDFVNDPLIQAGLIGFARGVLGYAEAYLDGKVPFDLGNFVKGIARTGVMAWTVGVASGSPAAAWIAVPFDIGVSSIKKKA